MATVYVDEFTWNAADAAAVTYARTGYGGTPSAILVSVMRPRSETTDAASQATAIPSFGYAISNASRRCYGWHSANAADVSIEFGQWRSDAVGISCTSAGVLDGALDVASFDADGVTFVVDDQIPASVRVQVVAIMGMESAAILDITESATAAPTTQNVTGAGFQPDFVLLTSYHTTTVAATPFADMRLMIGMASGPGAESCVLALLADNGIGAIATRSYARSGEVIAMLDATTPYSPNAHATFTQFTADGFDLSWTERASSRLLHALVLKGDVHQVGVSAVATDASPFSVTTPGMTPVGGLILSHMLAEATADTVQLGCDLSLGAFRSASGRSALGYHNENAPGDGFSDVASAIEHDAVLVGISAAEAVDTLMDVQSLNAGSVTFVMDDPAPSGFAFFYWIVGNAAAGGGARRRVMMGMN